MSEPAPDALSQIEDAFMALLKARASRLKRVLRPENLPAKKGQLPACAVDTGDETIRYLGVVEGGERVIERDVQLDLVVFHDDGVEDARREMRLDEDRWDDAPKPQDPPQGRETSPTIDINTEREA